MREKLMVAYHEQRDEMDLALWRNESGVWICHAASKKLRWLKQMRSHQASQELKDRGYTWKWRDAKTTLSALKQGVASL